MGCGIETSWHIDLQWGMQIDWRCGMWDVDVMACRCAMWDANM